MLRSVRIRLVRNTWERLARLDPYWAIINRPDWRRNRAELDEFFAGGRALIARQLAQVATAGQELRWERAMDFGCGVGRLSVALAAKFREVVGVDISAEMIALARRHHSGVNNLTFVRNTRADLQAFPADDFDLVYSLITLQHVPPPLIRSYLCEFVRICRPGGILLFQLPARELNRKRRNLWSLWPPTVATRVRRVSHRVFNRLIPINPVIDVHCLVPEEVRAILASAGAEVLAHWSDDSCGPNYESSVYLARKR
jgi:SAM-dependent methyltransferase